jgi:DNA-binding winged helix-turn-helix (wHTH) protein/TolB-like protein
MSLRRSCLQFGEYRLDPEERTLLRGDREAIPLAPKVFDLLVFLAENSGHLVTRDALMKAVWPDSFVDESNLTVNISLLRKTLGNAADGRPFIETIPKRGYRFLSEVTFQPRASPSAEIPYGVVASQINEGAGAIAALAERPTDAAIAVDRFPPPAPMVVRPVQGSSRLPVLTKHLWLIFPLLAIVGLGVLLRFRSIRVNSIGPPAAIQGRRSLAVMPFQNLRHDPDTDYLGFALADSIIGKLAYVSELSVRPSSSVARYASQSPDPVRVANELAVNTLLTGTYVKDGDNLRIAAQLVEPETQRMIWHDTIDVKFHNLLAVQDTVTQQIVSGLQLRLSPREAEHLGASTASDPRAYEYYLRGVDLYASGNFLYSIAMLESSARLDSRSAMTWAMLGRAYTTNASLQFGGSEGYRQAQAAYEKALALEPAQIACRVYLANLFTDTGRVESAVPLLKQALAANPNFAEADWELSYAYRFGGLLHESVELAERARTLDPSVKLNSSAINAYLYLGQYERFLASLPNGDNNPYILFYRGFAEYHLGQKNEANRDFDRAYQSDPTILQTQVGEALRLTSNGQSRKAIELLRTTETRISRSGVIDPEAIYKVAEAYSVSGDRQAAIRTFRRSIENGFFCYAYFVRDPLLDSIRADPEFSELLRNAQHRSEEFQRKFS